MRGKKVGQVVLVTLRDDYLLNRIRI